MSIYSSVETCISDLQARLGVNFTDEQRDFMSDFTVPTISFSSPGTGKTRAAVAGLILAETYHGVPGNNIYACSFTRASTGELRLRHANDCAKLGMTQTVHFNTLHSLCYSIIKANYRLLGMQNLNQSGDKIPLQVIGDILNNVANDNGFTVTPNQVRPIVEACNSLNSTLTFDPEHIQSSYAFKRLKIDYQQFVILRRALYQLSKNMDTVSQEDILLYTLEILLMRPEVSGAFKRQCRILLVDEFQDLSLLELRLVTMLSDCVIAIGDIKQQIYAFQGACQEIVEEYSYYFPNARVANLNKSWRCASSIVEFSKTIIHPNNMGEEGFVSMGKDGTVELKQGLVVSDLCAKIEEDYRANRNTFTRDIMFLFRNNYSATPIAEEFFKRRVPFRVNKYEAASRIPVIRELIAIVELAANPKSPDNVQALRYILREMSDYKNYRESPIYKIMCKTGQSIFEIEYNYRNPQQAKAAMELLFRVRDMLDNASPMRDILNTIFPLYNEVYLVKREPYLDMPSRYYINMVQPLVHKTYFQFVQDEVAKLQAINEANARGVGVRCYTFHAAKGLEADDVYMLDCDAGVCPNMRQLDKMDVVGCQMEKARDIRNERSLLFVAATRAKERLYVSYNMEMSPLLQEYNVFQQYDQLYADFRKHYWDAEAFEVFIGKRKEMPNETW